MKIIEKGEQMISSVASCDCNNKGTSKCKGCEDSNISTVELKEVYSEE